MWRSWPRKGQEKARHPHIGWGLEMACINHFYFYLWDLERGAAFWKANAYAPFPIWLWLNGHEFTPLESADEFNQHPVGIARHSSRGIILTDRCSGAFLIRIIRAALLACCACGSCGAGNRLNESANVATESGSLEVAPILTPGLG